MSDDSWVFPARRTEGWEGGFVRARPPVAGRVLWPNACEASLRQKPCKLANFRFSAQNLLLRVPFSALCGGEPVGNGARSPRSPGAPRGCSSWGAYVGFASCGIFRDIMRWNFERFCFAVFPCRVPGYTPFGSQPKNTPCEETHQVYNIVYILCILIIVACLHRAYYGPVRLCLEGLRVVSRVNRPRHSEICDLRSPIAIRLRCR